MTDADGHGGRSGDDTRELDALWLQLSRAERGERADLLDELSGALLQRGRRREALEAVEAARHLFESAGSPADVARSDHNAGVLLTELGDRDGALVRYRRAADGYRSVLQFGEAAAALRAEADLLVLRGDHAAALVTLEAAAGLHDDADEPVRASLARIEAAELLLGADRVDEACSLLTLARGVLRADGALLWVARADQLLADVAGRHGAWHVASGLLEAARAVFDAADLDADRDRCDDLLAGVLIDAGKVDEAVGRLERARARRRSGGDPLGVAWCDLYLSRARARQGDPESAAALRRSAAAVFDAAGLDEVLRRRDLHLQDVAT